MIDALATGLSFMPLQFSRNIIDYTIAAADLDLTSRADLRYLVELQKQTYWGSGTWESVRTFDGREKPAYSIMGTLIQEGARFILNRGRQGLIDSLLDSNKPERNQNNMRAILTQTMSYRLITQTVGGVPALDLSSITGPYWAIQAGLSNQDFANHGDTFWSEFQTQKRKFLTWRPQTQKVSAGQEEYLHFPLNISPTPSEIRLRVRFRNYGEEPTAAVTVMSLENAPMYSLVSAPVGPDIVGMSDEYTYYDVWLADQNNYRLTEVRTYELDTTHQPYARCLLFRNSLGGWDTLRLTGKAQGVLGVSQNTARRLREKRSNMEFSELLVINTEGSRSLTVSTGYMSTEAIARLRWLDELLLTEQCYIMGTRGHEPVQVLTNSLIDDEDDAGMTARSFQLRILNTVENYSDIPASFPVAARPTVWVGSNISYVLDGYGKRTGYVTFATLRKAYANNFELVLPYEIKPNSPGDPDYVGPVMNSAIVVGSTPYPNAAISRAASFAKNDCLIAGTGTTPLIEIAAGKYGGEVEGEADALAEAEYTSLNTQAYANTHGICMTAYQSVAISRASTYIRNNCSSSQAGSRWTITVPAGQFESYVSQADANAQANAYADSLDTQANANINGSCVAGQFYEYAVPEGYFHYRANIPTDLSITIYKTSGKRQGNDPANIGTNGDTTGVYAAGTNDLDFFASNIGQIMISAINTQGTERVCSVYIYSNGTLYTSSTDFTVAAGGSYGLSVGFAFAQPGAKVYVKIVWQ